MVAIKNVAVVGASGSLGAPVLKALIDSGKFNVTAVSRTSSKSTFPTSVKVVQADYTSVESLTTAFEGQDAVVSTVGNEGFLGQNILIDAAIAAGVKRFLPSEFGSNIDNPKTASLPVFGYKVATRKYIEEKVKAGANITYTYVINGPFLDWCIEYGLFLNWKEGKATVYDSGDQKLSTTTLASVGLAVVGVLSHYEETKNKSVFVQELAISQNQLLQVAAKVAPEKKWEIEHASLADIEKSANESLAKGEINHGVMFKYLYVGIFGEGYGSLMEKDDNELLGVPRKTEADIAAIFKSIFGVES